MTSQFPPSEFDKWAASYDTSTRQGSSFPFEGYLKVLETIVTLSAPQAGRSVLDLGIGTGNLAQLFAKIGCQVWGIDFSAGMLELARIKIPGAVLALSDLRADWPPEFHRQYDHIISAYTFHHFPLDVKVAFIRRLMENHLQPGGTLVIGDIAFRNAAEEASLRRQMGKDWEQEYYWLAEDSLQSLRVAGINANYQQVSSCAGVFHLKTG